MGFDGFFESDLCRNNYKAAFSCLFADQLGILLLFYKGNVIPAVTPFKWNDKCATLWLYNMRIMDWGLGSLGPGFQAGCGGGTSFQPVPKWYWKSLVYCRDCQFKCVPGPGSWHEGVNQAGVRKQTAKLEAAVMSRRQHNLLIVLLECGSSIDGFPSEKQEIWVIVDILIFNFFLLSEQQNRSLQQTIINPSSLACNSWFSRTPLLFQCLLHCLPLLSEVTLQEAVELGLYLTVRTLTYLGRLTNRPISE